jgi:hypothetical protein
MKAVGVSSLPLAAATCWPSGPTYPHRAHEERLASSPRCGREQGVRRARCMLDAGWPGYERSSRSVRGGRGRGGALEFCSEASRWLAFCWRHQRSFARPLTQWHDGRGTSSAQPAAALHHGPWQHDAAESTRSCGRASRRSSSTADWQQLFKTFACCVCMRNSIATGVRPAPRVCKSACMRACQFEIC